MMKRKLWLGMDMERSIQSLHKEYVASNSSLFDVFNKELNSRLR